MALLPRVTLWAWERREDFRSIDSQQVALAYLDRTLTIGLNVQSQLRRNPVWLPPAVLTVRATNYGTQGVGANTASSKAAFYLLLNRYPTSPWAVKTPYYY